MTTLLHTLFAHLRWADAQARTALVTLGPDTPTRARAVALYAHVAAAEHVWLSRLEGRPPEHPVWPALDLDAATALATASGEGLAALADRLDADAAARTREVVYRNSAGQEFRNRVEDVLAQVALHGSYHRGQLALLVRDGGGTPAPTDYIVFVRGVPAPAR